MLRRLASRRSPLHFVVCGGGASGVLLAQAVAAQAMERVRITIIEPRPKLGRGLAYSTPFPEHLLNVRAGRLSVSTSEALDFVAWLNKRKSNTRAWTGDDFAPRMLYGDYLEYVFERVRERDWLEITHVRHRALTAERHGVGWLVRTDRARSITGDVLILATGNEPPAPIDLGLGKFPRNFLINSPWDFQAISRIPQTAAILLIGFGLTGVDVLLQLIGQNHKGPIFALSRHALQPKAHDNPTPEADMIFRSLPNSMSRALRGIRRAIGRDQPPDVWQSAMEALRGAMQELWSGFNETEQRRFLRHVQRFWDVHRHRVAPQVGQQIDQAVKDQQLQQIQGRVVAISALAAPHAARVSIASAGKVRDMLADHIINCTGPSSDPARSHNPFIQSLLATGIARTDRLALGIDVDSMSAIVAKDGRTHSDFFALGPPTRGKLLEITAVPEIRHQAEQIAQRALRRTQR